MTLTRSGKVRPVRMSCAVCRATPNSWGGSCVSPPSGRDARLHQLDDVGDVVDDRRRLVLPGAVREDGTLRGKVAG